MRFPSILSACILLLGAAPLCAQDQSAAMAETIRQLRATAAQMKGLLPDSDIAEMLRSADELEQANREGAFAGATGGEAKPDIIAHMEQTHAGRFEWLMHEEACAGYQWETWRSYSMTVGDRLAERNAMCKRAFSLFEEYHHLAVKLAQGANEKLSAFDQAAHEAVDYYNKN